MKKKIGLSLLILATFFAARNLKYFWGYVVYGKEQWNTLDQDFASELLIYSQLVLVAGVCFLVFRKQTLIYLGLNKGLFHGFVIGLLCSLPMFVGYALLSKFNLQLNPQLIYRDLFLAGFFEEFLFRGFLFGLLYYVVGWGFIPAVLLPSVYFGLGHLYQAHNFNEVIAVFLFTFVGSAGFAWFYTAWKNLWVVVFLHGFMDVSWDMFQIETNVTGNLAVNVFRFVSLGLIIFLSLRQLKTFPERSIRGKLWINQKQ